MTKVLDRSALASLGRFTTFSSSDSFFWCALMAPTFAAGSITGEKERKTYELLLASPLRPSTILVGKLLSSLSYLVILIVSSLPLMILCYLLGGLLLSEITRSYLVLILAAGTFGLVSVACSSYFRRTSSALVVSYLVILPLAVLCVVLTGTDNVVARDFVSIAILPPWCLAAWTVLGILVNQRLLHPPDVGSEGKDVVDEEEEMKYAIGVVIDRDLFPDKLFAPAKRTDLMPDGTNPVLDKELRSEIFSQGTLMLRVVIQVSMLLSIPLMAALLFLRSDKAGYYVAYVLAFNMLVGPVFSAGSITQERERQTLSLLLTTLLRPGQIVFAKLMAALRVSTVLTFLLTEQLLLAYILLPELRQRFWTLLVFLLIIATTCMATSTIGLMCSSLARRTSTAMVMTYLTLLTLFVLPLGVQSYLQTIASVSEEQLAVLTVTSPFSAALAVPMHNDAHRSLDQPASGRRRSDPDFDRSRHKTAGLGDLSWSLPAPGPCLLRDNLRGVSVAVVACGRPRLEVESGCRLPNRAVRRVAAQGSVLEIPHIVRPAHQAPATWEWSGSSRPGAGLAPRLSG